MAVLAMEQAREVSQGANTQGLKVTACRPLDLMVGDSKLLLGPASSRLLVQGAQVIATRYSKSQDMSLPGHFGLDSGSRVAAEVVFVSMLELGLPSSVSALSNEQGRKYACPGAVQRSSQVLAVWLLYACSRKLMVSQDESNGQSGRASSTNIDRDRSSLLKSAGEEEHKERCEANTPHGIQEPSTEVVHKDLTGMLLSAAKEEAGDAKKDVVSEGAPAEDQQEDEDNEEDEQNGEDEDAGGNSGDKNNGNNDNNEGEEEGEEEEYAAEDEDEEEEDDEDEEAEGARGPPRRKINVNTKAIDVGESEDEDDDEAEPEPPKKRVKN